MIPSGMTDRKYSYLWLPGAFFMAWAVFVLDRGVGHDLPVSILYLFVIPAALAGGGEIAVLVGAPACMALAFAARLLAQADPAPLAAAAQALLPCIAIGVVAFLLLSQRRLRAASGEADRRRAEIEHFLNSVPFVLWRSNPRGEIEYLNEHWTHVTGLDRSSVLANARYNDVVHPDDLAALHAAVPLAIATQTLTNLEIRVRQADGSYRWMQIYDKPVRSPITGEIERFGGLSDIHQEVTAKEELQKVRHELEESQRELTVFADSVPQLLWRSTAEGKWDFLNQRFTEITGVEREDGIAGQTWRECVHPEDIGPLREVLTRSLETGEDIACQVRLRHKDGSYHWMSMARRAVRSAETGEILRFYGGATDIHNEVLAQQRVNDLMANLERRVAERTAELLRTEARYSSLFDVGGISFAEMDFSLAKPVLDRIKAQGVQDLQAYFEENPQVLEQCLSNIRTTRVNRALAQMMGYADLAELAANPPARNAEDGRDVLISQLEMIYYDQEHISGQTVLIGKDSRRIPVHFNVNRLSDDLHLSNLVDLSEQQRIEEMRRAAQDELARANRIATVGAYSATIAHELNQPIASMAMDVQTTMRWLTGETPNLEAAIRGIERLTRTVHRVQAIVEHTRESLAPRRRELRRVDISALARATCGLLESEVRRAEAQLVLNCDPDLALVLADPVEFQQVLVNLITNAAEAMLAGTDPRKITVEISNASEGIAVSVRDTGPGIADDILDKLFEPFFTTKATGMGMGLQVCRNAVQGMGGNLRVRNEPGGGAVFSFTVPGIAALD